MSVVLQQFARAPVPGRVKTRMQPALSPGEACALHEQLVLWTTRSLLQAQLGAVELWTAGGGDHALFQQCLSEGVRRLCVQQGVDLGERMQHALTAGLQKAGRVVLVGSDCPWIDSAYLALAVQALERHDIVLGPALDGGFVLIAVRCALRRSVFDGVSWGTGTVLEETLARAAEAGFSTELLPPLQDIDRPDDLAAWRALRAAASGSGGSGGSGALGFFGTDP